MISFIQKILQKHSKWMFGILLIVIVIPFVFTIGNSPGISGLKKNANSMKFFGYDLDSPKEMQRIARETSLSFHLANGENASSQKVFQNYFFMRLFNLHFANLYNIPGPTEEQLQEFIETQMAFKDKKTGEFSLNLYNDYLEDIKREGIQNSAFARSILIDDFRAKIVQKIFKTPGYVLSAEIENQWQLSNTKWSIILATLDTETINKKVEFSEDKIKSYYDKNISKYMGEPKVKMSYLMFPSKNFVSSIYEAKEAELKLFFEENKKLFKDKKQPNPKTENVKEEPNWQSIDKELVKKEYIIYNAQVLAETKANDLIFEIYNKDIKLDSEKFAELTKNITRVHLPAFSKKEFPKNHNLTNEVLNNVFLLDKISFYSEPIRVKDGVVILLKEKDIDPQIESLDSVRTRVINDLYKFERKRIINEKKDILFKSLKEAKDAQDFKNIAQGLNLQISSFDSVTAQNIPNNLSSNVLKTIENLPVKSISSPIKTDKNKISFVFVSEKILPKIDPKDKTLENMSNTQKMIMSFFGANELLNEIIELGLKKHNKK